METTPGPWKVDRPYILETFLRGMETAQKFGVPFVEEDLETFLRGMETG